MVAVGFDKDYDAVRRVENPLRLGKNIYGHCCEEGGLVDDQQLLDVVAVQHVEVAEDIVGPSLFVVIDCKYLLPHGYEPRVSSLVYLKGH